MGKSVWGGGTGECRNEQTHGAKSEPVRSCGVEEPRGGRPGPQPRPLSQLPPPPPPSLRRGVPLPVALHVRWAVCPSRTLTAPSRSSFSILGGTGRSKETGGYPTGLARSG